MSPEVDKTEEEWRQDLSPSQYQVLRQTGTEPPFSGKYVHNHDDGTYRCAGCGAVLFSSGTKFDSGSGWPSFYQPEDEDNIERIVDKSHFMTRTEVRLQALRRAPRPRLRRRAEANGRAVLHQQSRPGVRSRGRGGSR